MPSGLLRGWPLRLYIRPVSLDLSRISPIELSQGRPVEQSIYCNISSYCISIIVSKTSMYSVYIIVSIIVSVS